jgi:hypothetical protein
MAVADRVRRRAAVRPAGADAPPRARANLAYSAQGFYADLRPAWQDAFGDRPFLSIAPMMPARRE